MFKPGLAARQAERILVYGDTKVGKSSCWLDVALHMVKGGSSGRMFIVDTDISVEAAFEFYPELEDVITHFPIYEWDDLKEANAKIKEAKLAKENGDWTVIDMISYPWVEVRSRYTQALYGMDLEEYVLETRNLIAQAKANKQGHEREFGDWKGKDWDAMAKIYHNWELPITLRNRSHVMAMAEERSATADDRGTDAKTVKLWKRTGGFKPYGHRSMPHRFRTVIRATNPGSQRNLISGGDRFRECVWKAEGNERGGIVTLTLGDIDEGQGFVQTYLKPVAGWRYREKK